MVDPFSKVHYISKTIEFMSTENVSIIEKSPTANFRIDVIYDSKFLLKININRN